MLHRYGGRRASGLLLAGAVTAVLLGATPSAGAPMGAPPQVGASSAHQIGTVKIAGSRYLVVNPVPLLSRIRSPWTRAIATVIRSCPGAKAHGFVSTSGLGVVVRAPSTITNCYPDDETVGGGPGALEPCVQFFQTVNRAFYAFVLATNARTCSHMTTQVPSGYWGRTNRPLQGLELGTPVLIKCQTRTAHGWLDYVVLSASALPASKSPFFIHDDHVDTGGRARLPGVPLCSGVEIAL